MKNYILLLFLPFLFWFVSPTNAQDADSRYHCSYAKNRLVEKTTIADSAENNYDVKYVKLNLNMTILATTISGDVTTKAMVISSDFNKYVFELISDLTIDSVKINYITYPVVSVGDIHTVTLSYVLPMGSMFTAQVFYHGTPPSGTLYGATGINALTSPSWGADVTFTLSESYHAKEWWPCKQSLQDKIDSCDIWLTVQSTLKAGSNGLLQHITPVNAGYLRYEWKERKPIDYYLISASVSNYMDYSYYMHFTGSSDSMLVQNYIYQNPATLPYYKSVIDSTGMMIDYFSTIYGRYPFWQEKYGHCMAPLGGGMEHQTMTTLGFFEGTLVAHELSHQWFGDNVTCRTWGDIFMNEGLASYSEDLFIDRFRSHTKMLTDMQTKQASVLSFDTGTIYCSDTTSENRIFDSRLSYDKGACFLHMLRFVINNDSLFFAGYQSYQQMLKDSTGLITDFKNIMEQTVGTTVNGLNLDTFFNQWVYLQGYPKFKVTWNQSALGEVFIKIVQTGAVTSSVPFFTIPIDLQFHSNAGDTLVRVLNNVDTQVFQFNWSDTMAALYFDPNFWLVYSLTATPSRDSSLGVNNLSLNSSINPVIYPNPSKSSWHVFNLSKNSQLILSDISGRQIWKGSNNDEQTLQVNGEPFVAGLYLLQIADAEKHNYFYKIIKE